MRISQVFSPLLKNIFLAISPMTNVYLIKTNSLRFIFQRGNISNLNSQKLVHFNLRVVFILLLSIQNFSQTSNNISWNFRESIINDYSKVAPWQFANSPNLKKTTKAQFSANKLASVYNNQLTTASGCNASLIYALRGDDTSAFWVYNISANSWTSLSNTPQNIKIASGLAFAEDAIYVLRGDKKQDFWKYNISGNSWSSLANFPSSPDKSSSLEYDGNGNLYAIDGGSSVVYKYNILSNSWSVTTGLPGGIKFDAGASLISDGKNIYALRGQGSTDFFRYNAGTNTWTTMAVTPGGISTGADLVFDGTYIYALRGITKDFYRYNISLNSWTTQASTPEDISQDGALTFDGTYIYGFQGNSNRFWRYNIGSNSWTSMSNTLGNVGAGADLAANILNIGTPIFTLGTTSTRCQGANTVTYTATSTNSTGINYSLDASSLTAGNTINSSTGTVTYVAAWSGTSTITASATGCVSNKTSQHVVTINSTPFITGTTPNSRCGTGTVTLGATSSAGTINWYAGSTGGSSLGTGTSFTTPSISTTTSYWVDATLNGCTTASRTAVTATINPIPTITGTTPNSRCGTGTVTLGATSSAGTINWYAGSTGGSSLGTGTSFTTPSISTTTSYWVDATLNGCTTASRTVVKATITKNNWSGVNTDWNDPANWCAGVPTIGFPSTLDVVIPTGLSNYPIIFSGAAAGYVKTIVLEINTTLNIQDNNLRVTENLKLDGKIDLEGEAQLLQDLNSVLDPTSSGTLERDQQGTADKYTYNYWSSPVGLSNNTTNNNSYTLPDIFQGVNFLTSGYDGSPSPLGIADYWIWKFSNLTSGDYSKWQHVRSTGALLAGEGFTMKGPGTGSISTTQNYVLLGKPNNGNINLNITAGNDYLVGNPYPSALDADQFIIDNDAIIGGTGGSTTGTLYFWQHWGGGSHYISDYEGGYATYTLAGGNPGPSMGTPPPGFLKTPGRYIPIAQGFFVTAETSGTIKFNNAQRVFQIEDGINSLFVKSSNTKNAKTSNNQNKDVREKIRLGFNSVNTIRRQLLATVDPKASIHYDRGYDALYIDELMDDMYWLIDTNKYIIQGVDKITEQTVLPLGIHTKNDGLNSIYIEKIENAPSNLNIYLHDKQLNIYHKLLESNYKVFLYAGEYLNRFEITFSTSQSLDLDDSLNIDIPIELCFLNKNIIIENPGSKYISSIEMFNFLGQFLFKFEPESNKNHMEYNVSQLRTGIYIFKIQTEFGKITKKVLIK